MKTRPSSLLSGFTLIELLVVVAIIAILASLVLATAGYVQEKAGRSRAEAEIAAMSAALESYKVDNGQYPDSAGEEDLGPVVVAALMPATGKVYFEFPPRMLETPNSPQTSNLLDPFGGRYRYQFEGDDDRSGTNFFDLWSTGKRATKGNLSDADWEAQWIKNW